jgi:hypothetical protein
MDSINIPILVLIVALIGVVKLLVSVGGLRFKTDNLPAPDLRRCERNGSAEYFIRASRGINRE